MEAYNSSKDFLTRCKSSYCLGISLAFTGGIWVNGQIRLVLLVLQILLVLLVKHN